MTVTETLPFIDLNQVLDLDEPVYAHTGSCSMKETLQDHTLLCQQYFTDTYYFKRIDEVLERYVLYFPEVDHTLLKKWIKRLLCNLVTFHDIGKINPLFQRAKMDNKVVCDKIAGVDGSSHSHLSAVIYLDYFFDQVKQMHITDRRINDLFITLVIEHAYIISRHHGHLNTLNSFISSVQVDISEESGSPFMDTFNALCHGQVKYLRQWHTTDIKQWFRNLRKCKVKDKSNYKLFLAKEFYYRMVYSLLVMSDYYATYAYQSGVQLPVVTDFSFSQYVSAYQEAKLTQKIQLYKQHTYRGKDKSALDKSKNINDLRSEIYLDVMNQYDQFKDRHMFFLEAPTGSGKSNVALGLSMQMMEEKQKLFYIYPFNTLVEQNKQTLQDYFKDKIQDLDQQLVVINSLTPIQMTTDEEKSDVAYDKALYDREFLNYPFIISTHVSFFDLLFGDNKSSAMAFYQIINSVVVLDEIQNYKNTIWSELILSLSVCADLLNMHIVIMSATLPSLELFLDNVAKEEVVYLLPKSNYYFQHPLFKNRVQLDYHLLDNKIELDDLLESVIACQANDKKILIEFITKKDAETFYEMLKSNEKVHVPVRCLTGDDTLYQREAIIGPIRDQRCQSIILVSTQVIEAGVDIDMDIGFKNISTLDGDEQFLGRINRSCKRNDGIVYFFCLTDVKQVYRNDFRANTDFTLKNEICRDYLFNKNFQAFYQKVIHLVKQRNASTNDDGLEKYMIERVAKLDYKSIQERMRLIEDDQWTVDVFYNRTITVDGQTIIGAKVWEEYKKLIKDTEMNYSKRQYFLSCTRVQMHYFIQRISKKEVINYTESFGNLLYVEDGERYFKDGRFSHQEMTDLQLFV